MNSATASSPSGMTQRGTRMRAGTGSAAARAITGISAIDQNSTKRMVTNVIAKSVIATASSVILVRSGWRMTNHRATANAERIGTELPRLEGSHMGSHSDTLISRLAWALRAETARTESPSGVANMAATEMGARMVADRGRGSLRLRHQANHPPAAEAPSATAPTATEERRDDGSGKSARGRVDLGGRRNI